jgi:hypothetical protein
MASRSLCFARSNVSWPYEHNMRHVQDAVNFLGRRLHLGIMERPTSRQFLVSFVCSRLCLGICYPCCRTRSTSALSFFRTMFHGCSKDKRKSFFLVEVFSLAQARRLQARSSHSARNTFVGRRFMMRVRQNRAPTSRKHALFFVGLPRGVLDPRT